MAKLKKPDQKALELKRTGTLNPRPDSVSDGLFKENPFFDRKDLLQVRYEMLRRHSVEGVSIVDVATRFGVSRPTVYQAKAAFQQPAWRAAPKHRGPKQGQCHPPRSSSMCGLCELPSRLTTIACIRAVQKVWDYGSPPQSGAALTGKNRNWRKVRFRGTMEAYEGLRLQAVNRTDEENTWKAVSFSSLRRQLGLDQARGRTSTSLRIPCPSGAGRGARPVWSRTCPPAARLILNSTGGFQRA